jgi:DNA-binding GntR family transcriptional regulator
VRLDLPPGAVLDKAALCRRFGVSRFPVSEALGRLADEGFVEILPQRGTRVARIDMADCRQAMFIRRALEAEAVRMVAPHATAGLNAALADNLRQQRSVMNADDRGRFHELDLAFHAHLLDARVRVAVDAARATLDRMRQFLCSPQRQAATFAEHEAIAAALARHDGAAAGRSMEAHLDAVMAELTEFASAHPEAMTVEGRAEAAA